MSDARNRRYHPVLVAAWLLQLAAVIFGSLVPGRMVPEVIGQHDKWAHFGGYVLLGFFPLAGWQSLIWGNLLALGAIPMGAGLELMQHFVPGRTPDLADAAANSLGVLAGMSAAYVFRAVRFRRKASE